MSVHLHTLFPHQCMNVRCFVCYSCPQCFALTVVPVASTVRIPGCFSLAVAPLGPPPPPPRAALHTRGISTRVRLLRRLPCSKLTVTTGGSFGIVSHSPSVLSLLFVTAHLLYSGESSCTGLHSVPRCLPSKASVYGFCGQAPGLYSLADHPWRPTFLVYIFFPETFF